MIIRHGVYFPNLVREQPPPKVGDCIVRIGGFHGGVKIQGILCEDDTKADFVAEKGECSFKGETGDRVKLLLDSGKSFVTEAGNLKRVWICWERV